MTWRLVSQSFRLLREEPSLLIFPVLSTVGVVLLSIPFVLLLFAGNFAEGIQWKQSSWLVAFGWYAAISFATIFFNCALAACVQMRFNGEHPTIAAGISRAASRAHVILLWALLTATVGRVLAMFEEKAGWIARLILAGIGLSWNIATFLMVPVLVMEDHGVMDSVKRSAALLKQTWGEQLVSGIWFGWLALLCAIPGVILGALGANGYPLFLIPAVLWFAAEFAAFGAASEIFTVVLYRYATTGEAPYGYDAEMLGNALRRK